MPPNANTSPPPIVRDRYQLLAWLGQGGAGMVYKAHDSLLDRDVAIKFLNPALTGSEVGVRFLREARLVAKLAHPNIMSIFDVGEDQGWNFLVLEYIPGTDLHTLMEKSGKAVSAREVVQILQAVLPALAYAHSLGIIHRDVKPENIMFTPDGKVKVTDFGLALARSDARLTQDGGLVGTVLYMSPEVIQGQEIDARADLYSLGAVAYELLCGQPPFMGDQFVQIISKVLYSEPQPLFERCPGIPAKLEQVVLRLLSKNPAERYASAEDVLDAISGIVLGVGPDPAHGPFSVETTLSIPSILRSIVRSSSPGNLRPAPSASAPDDEPLLTLPQGAEMPVPLTQELLLYASAEDNIASIESERRRLAGMLKSDIIEPLNLLLSQAGTYEQTLGANQMARMAVSVLASLARQVLQQARDIEGNLHPAVLESLGLETALENLAGQYRRMRGTQIDLELVRLPERLPARMELALFRLTQDAFAALASQNLERIIIRLRRKDKLMEYELLYPARAGIESGALLAGLQWLEQLGAHLEQRQDGSGAVGLFVRFGLPEPVDLTPRELDVVRLLAEGMSNKEIARVLSISPRTVNFHLDHLFSKLGVRTRTEAAIFALQQGWVQRQA